MVILTDHTMIGKQYYYLRLGYKSEFIRLFLVECTDMDYVHTSSIEGIVLKSWTDNTQQDEARHPFVLSYLYELNDKQNLIMDIFR
jgi:hypothetical protein